MWFAIWSETGQERVGACPIEIIFLENSCTFENEMQSYEEAAGLMWPSALTPVSLSLCLCRLALYVYEYLLHVGAQKSAQTFLSEVRRSSLFVPYKCWTCLCLGRPTGVKKLMLQHFSLNHFQPSSQHIWEVWHIWACVAGNSRLFLLG